MIKALVLMLVRIYQMVLPIFMGMFGAVGSCRYVLSCSNYFLHSINEFGLFQGMILGIKRLLSCHPWARAEKRLPASRGEVRGLNF